MTNASANRAVEARWTEYRTKFSAEYPALLLFLDEALKYPKIASLFPFLSMHRLCFSRCTRYPFYVNFIICSKPDGQFSVEKTDDGGGWVLSTPIGQGDAKAVAQLLNDLIPSDYGPAIEGTGDDIRGFWRCLTIWLRQRPLAIQIWWSLQKARIQRGPNSKR